MKVATSVRKLLKFVGKVVNTSFRRMRPQRGKGDSSRPSRPTERKRSFRGDSDTESTQRSELERKQEQAKKKEAARRGVVTPAQERSRPVQRKTSQDEKKSAGPVTAAETVRPIVPRGAQRGIRPQEVSEDTTKGKDERREHHSFVRGQIPGQHPVKAEEDEKKKGVAPVEESLVKVSRPLHIVTNHFELRWIGKDSKKEFQVHQYRVEFEPPDVPPEVRCRILEACSKDIAAPFVFDSVSEFYCGSQFPETQRKLEVEPLEDEPNTKYSACLVYTKTLPLSDPIYMQVYNLIVKKCLFGMGLDEIGRSYFDKEAVLEYPQFKVQIWPGYSTSMKECEKGLLLCVDVTNKVVRNENLLGSINLLKNSHRRRGFKKSLFEHILDEIGGSLVITSYNKLSYRINCIHLDMSPKSTFTLKDGTEISFSKYYKIRHQLHIKDLDQPLISATPTNRQKGEPKTKTLFLIPELCSLTGLTDAMRMNMKIMEELEKHLHMEPQQRIQNIQEFMTRLGGDPKCKKLLEDWGFAFEPKLMRCTVGRVLPSETIFFGNDQSVKLDQKNEWAWALRSNTLVSCVDLTKWVVIVSKRELVAAKDFVQTMIRVASPLGFKISEPLNFETVADVGLPTYLRTVDKILKNPGEQPQLVMCILPNNDAELYNAIKKRLTQDVGIQSQCLLQRNLRSKALMPIANKLVLQLSTKLGGEPWTLTLPPELKRNTVSIGLDIVKKKEGGARGAKVCSMVSTMSEKHSKYFSVVFSSSDEEEFEEQLHRGVIRCVDAFAMANDMTIPTWVVFYRCGADEGMLTSGEVQKEADKIEDLLVTWYEFHKIKETHGFAYILVTRQTNTKMMSHKGYCKDKAGALQNPPPGTIVDTDFVEKDGKYKEFFLVPRGAQHGTVRPVQYRVLKDTFGLPSDVLQLYTYKLCHLYYNWTGSVSLPSVCQYAGKLVNQSAQALPGRPHARLSKYLHFL